MSELFDFAGCVDVPERAEVSWRVIREACDAIAGGEDRAGPIIYVAGVSCVVSGACWPGQRGGPAEGYAWAVVPVEDWRRPTFTHQELCRLWDRGERTRGDCTGQALQCGGRVLVKVAPIRLVAHDYSWEAEFARLTSASALVDAPTPEPAQISMF